MFMPDGSVIPCPACHSYSRTEEAHCPAWCDGEHDPVLWLDCCDFVVHSRTIAASADGRTTVKLQCVEDVDGADDPQLQLATDPDATLSIDGVEDFAALLVGAAKASRQIVGA